MFLSRNKKINIYPCKPQFYYINVGFKGGQQACFRDDSQCFNFFQGHSPNPVSRINRFD